MEDKKYIYEIEGLYPPNHEETRMGMWGFGINLDPLFAVKARRNGRIISINIFFMVITPKILRLVVYSTIVIITE